MDFIVLFLIVVLGLGFVRLFKSRLSPTALSHLQLLWFYHVVFGIYYCFFIQGDAIGYWEVAKRLNYTEFLYGLTQKGTYFMFSLNYFPSQVLGLSYFSGTLLYSLIGFMGLCFFYVTCYQLIPYNSSFMGYALFPFLFFLPNLHFWSCAVGKDTLLFFAVGAFVYGLLQPVKRLPLLLLALAVSYFVRPHITLFLALSFGIAYLLSSKVSTFQRVFFTLVLLGVGVAILPTVLEFARIEEATFDSFSQFSSSKSDVLSRANVDTRIDISSYPFPLKVFSFLFRPFFFDINGIPAVLASFENLLLLVLCFKVVRQELRSTFFQSPFVLKGLVLFLIFGTLAFSQSLGNIGIMIRMRNMFLPGLLLFILWSMSYQQAQQASRTV
ncbi:hypothetical protein [Flavobacterium sp.]|uniref:hypothetical protein n=1 Tax=Flavobacterium sp. TaxID=239 RepID=UPI002FDB7B73